MRYKNYVVKQGDTLQLIAQNHMNDMSQWTELAKYNNLKHPYLTEDPMDKLDNPHIAVVGDKIVIPVEVTLSALASAPLTFDSKKIIEEIALGRDFCLTRDLTYASNHGTHDEILELTTAPNGSVGYVKGVENLRQALLQRLWTKKGTLPLHPQYGSNLHEFIGKKLTAELIVQIELEMEVTCRIDPRVEDIQRVLTKHNPVDNSVSVQLRIRPTSFDNMLDFIVDMDGSGTITLTNL